MSFIQRIEATYIQSGSRTGTHKTWRGQVGPHAGAVCIWTILPATEQAGLAPSPSPVGTSVNTQNSRALPACRPLRTRLYILLLV